MKTNRARKLVVNILSLVMIIVSGLIIYDVSKEFVRSKDKKEELALIRQEIEELEKENENLEGIKKKLSDANYVQNYARGKHLMSKSEEQVFILPKIDD